MATADVSTTQQGLVRVMYVGRKPFAVDNVAGSGQTWNGKGDVKEVEADEAAVLCSYPDQWAIDKGKVPSESQVDKSLTDFHTSGKSLEAIPKAKEPKQRTLAELQLFVKKTYGLILKAKTKELALKELADIEAADEQDRQVGLSAAAVKSIAGPRGKARGAAAKSKSAKKR